MSRSNQLAGLITATPTATLDTINEINTSLNNDANLSTTLTNSIATKMPLAGGAFTGNVTTTGSIAVDDIIEKTSAHGVEIDGVTLKDSSIDGVANLDGSVGAHIGNSHATGYGVKIRGASDSTRYALTVNNNSDNPLMRVLGDGNVGIGTNDPSSYDSAQDNLVIKGTGNEGLSIIAGGNSNSTIAFGSGTGVSGYQGMIAYLNGSGGNAMTFRTQAVERMRIDSSGNVGIGTASPTSDGGTTLEIYNNTTPTLRLNDGGQFKSLVQLRGNDTEIRGSSGNIEFYTGNADGASSTERMRIDPSGRVGIGTSVTSASLNIHEPNSAPSIGAIAQSQLHLYNGTIVNDHSTLSFGYSNTGVTNTTAYISYVSTDQAAYGKGDLIFGTRNVTTDSAPTERMRISSDGNVAIGSGITPSFRLSTVTGSAVTYSSISGHSDKGIFGNLQPSIVCHDIGTMSVNDVRNLGFGARYDGDASGTKPSSYGVIRVFEHYTGQTGKGSQYISQLACGHSSTPVWYVRNSNVSNGSTYSNWYTVTMSNPSDERSKENVTDASNQLDVINQFKVKEFDYINKGDEPRQLGMMAQHVDTFAPEYVTKDDEDPDIFWRIKYDRMIPMLVKSIQELSAKVTALENA